MRVPSFNPKLHQYEILWKDNKGDYGVWGSTKEECLKNYNEITKNR